MLILAPTRELAAQIQESIRVYGANQKLRSRVIFGGVGEVPQIEALRAGCDIVVATPGRLLDLAERRLADLSGIRHLVLDEADRMLDMGFIHDIKRIIKMLPQQRQNLLFSATYTPDIRALAARILVKPVQVEVTPPNSTVDRVVQVAFRVAKDDKRHLLVHLFQNGVDGEGRWHQALVFTRTKHGANRLSQQLEQAGIRSAAIHGNKSQAARTNALADFKAGKLTALVATEVASRGLDIRELPQVVNYDMPHVPEDYVHRIGRTARAGNDGHAVSLVSQEEASLLRDIERTMRQAVPFSPTPAFVRQNHAPLPARPAQAPAKPRARQAHPPRHGHATAASSRAARLGNALDERGCRGRGVPDRIGRDHGLRGRCAASRSAACTRASRSPAASFAPHPASRSNPTAGSIACAGSVRPPPSATTASPSARVSIAVTRPARADGTSTTTGARARCASGFSDQVRRPAEACDHARKPLGRAAVRERLRERGARRLLVRRQLAERHDRRAERERHFEQARIGRTARQHRRSPRAAPAHCPRIARAARSCRSGRRRPAVPPPPRCRRSRARVRARGRDPAAPRRRPS